MHALNSLHKQTREVKDGNGTLDFEETVILMHVYRPCLGVEDRKIGQIGSKNMLFFCGGAGGGDQATPKAPKCETSCCSFEGLKSVKAPGNCISQPA